LPTPVCAGTPANLPSFNHTFGVDNIMKYCKYITQEGWVVNSTKGAYAPVGYYASETNATVWITLSWNPKCTSGGMYKVNKDDCEVYMGLILDGCNTNSRDKKWGGQLDAKCALWDITTRKGHDDRPPKGFRSVNKRSGWRGVLNRVVGDFFGS
jgi:hypothetical protein